MKKKQKPAPAAGFTHINNWGKRSKIAALPGCLREEVCRRLYDGQYHRTIVDWLNSLPEVRAMTASRYEGIPIHRHNLSRWYRSGYQVWLKRHELTARAEELTKVAARIAGDSGITLASGAAQHTAGKLLELLDRLGHATKGTAAKAPAGSANAGTTLPDTKALLDIARALTALRHAEQNDERISTDRQRLDRLDRQIALAQHKFQYITVTQLLSMLNDVRIREIDSGDFDNTEKIEAFGRHLFGSEWRPDSAAPQPPPETALEPTQSAPAPGPVANG